MWDLKGGTLKNSHFWAFALDNTTFEEFHLENIFEYVYIYISIAWGSWLWENNPHKSIGWSIQFTPHDWILREKDLAKLSILFHHAKVFSPCIASWQHFHFQIEPLQLMTVVYKIWNRIRSPVLFSLTSNQSWLSPLMDDWLLAIFSKERKRRGKYPLAINLV